MNPANPQKRDIARMLRFTLRTLESEQSVIEGGIVVARGKLGKLERECGEVEQKITITKNALIELGVTE